MSNFQPVAVTCCYDRNLLNGLQNWPVEGIIFCVLNVHRPFTAQTTERRRNFANFSDSAFCDDLRTTDWSRLATNIVHEDANAAANSLTDILNEVLERHAPMKSV